MGSNPDYPLNLFYISRRWCFQHPWLYLGHRWYSDHSWTKNDRPGVFICKKPEWRYPQHLYLNHLILGHSAQCLLWIWGGLTRFHTWYHTVRLLPWWIISCSLHVNNQSWIYESWFFHKTILFNYRGSLSYGNFITAIFQNFPEKFGLCVFWANLFHYCDFLAILSLKIALMK